MPGLGPGKGGGPPGGGRMPGGGIMPGGGMGMPGRGGKPGMPGGAKPMGGGPGGRCIDTATRGYGETGLMTANRGEGCGWTLQAALHGVWRADGWESGRQGDALLSMM